MRQSSSLRRALLLIGACAGPRHRHGIACRRAALARLAASGLSALCVVGVAALAVLAPSTTAFGQGADGEGGSTGPSTPSAAVMDDQNLGKDVLEYGTVYRRGVPFSCGSAPNPRRGTPGTSCRVEAKVTIPAKAAAFLGLSSNVIASGVATSKVEHFKTDDGDQGQVYFLPLSSKVKTKLKSKRVRALGVRIVGTVSDPDAPQVICASEAEGDDTPPLRSECSFTSGRKAVTYSGADGELLCWRFMPWWLATPAKWGKMCPRPVTTKA